MPKFEVVLERLVRETSTFSVEAPTVEEAKDKAQAVYQAVLGNDGTKDWESDGAYTEEEGSHYIVTPEGEQVPFYGVKDY